jgi:TRAP-type C4-dicarboxylate transport system permease small subunit
MSLSTALRIPLKIILFPVRLAISIFTGAMNFILASAIINKVLSVVSGILFLAFFGVTWSAIFVQKDMPLIARILIPSLAFGASYVTSPFTGALKYLRLLIERIKGFNDILKIK